VIYQHPLGYLLGMEGVALLKAFAGQYDEQFTRRRLAEIRSILDRADELGAGGPAEAISTEDGYAAWAPYYDRPGNQLIDIEQPHVRAILDGLPKGVALDAACGTGRHTVYLDSLGHSVIGVDRSPDMLSIAQEKLPDARFLRADLQSLPLPDDHIDTIVCALAFTHVRDLRPVFAEFARVLKPGGHLVVSDLRGTLSFGLPVVRETSDGRIGYLPFHQHATSDYLAAALPCGFQVRLCREPLGPDDDLVDGNGNPTAYPDDPITPPTEPYDTPPDIWDLHAWCPEAVNAAFRGWPRAIIWHFQLQDAGSRS
jgi:SAM-dependent methyltransferase